TDPKGRRQDLRKAAERDDPLVAVEAHEGRQGCAAIAVLAVEIVLDEIAARPGHPVEQPQPTGERERGAERKLARRGQDGALRLHARPGRVKGRVEVEAFVVDANG